MRHETNVSSLSYCLNSFSAHILLDGTPVQPSLAISKTCLFHPSVPHWPVILTAQSVPYLIAPPIIYIIADGQALVGHDVKAALQKPAESLGPPACVQPPDFCAAPFCRRDPGGVGPEPDQQQFGQHEPLSEAPDEVHGSAQSG